MKFKDLKSIFSNKIFRLIIIISFPIVIISSIFIYQKITYNNMLNKFKSYFNNFEYSLANNLCVSGEKFNIFKVLLLEKDLNLYFDEKINEVSNSINSNLISDSQAATILNEVNRYKLNSDDISSCFNLLDEDIILQDTYNKGVNLFKEDKFEESISVLNKITIQSPNYASSQNYINLSKQKLKNIIIAKVNEYIKNDYFTKALDYLNSYNKIFTNDTELTNKKNEIEKLKKEYLSKNKSSTISIQTSNESIVNSINTSNINTLNIGSYTNYLLYVSLTDQKTYLYKGSNNKWTLQKTILCSTGIEGKDTPTGVYEIGEKGEWFFSPKFDQGGKYWLQFYGNDYLFHSLPFKEDKTTVDDWTLGKKASHGCIRLPIEDSKWLFDNIPRGTKVIIK